MTNSNSCGLVVQFAGPLHGKSGNRALASNRKLTTLAASAFVCWALLGVAQPVRADDAYSGLRDFVQQLGPEQPLLVSDRAPNNDHPQINDDAFSALRDFVQRIEPGPLRLAAADPPKKAPKAKATGPVPHKIPGGGGDEATLVGEKVCLTCHASQAAAFGMTLMGRIFKNPRNAQEKGGCEGCHGAGSLHVKAGGGRGVGGIISFRKDDTSRPVADNNAICLSCHESGDRTYWKSSTHETRGVACTNCHTVMRKVSPKHQLGMSTELETCFQCHKDRRAQMQRTSHMPLREGKMACSDCHNPHGSFTDSLLREASINDTCYKCHAEKRGPYLWEHRPVRENCANCHEAHGSNNEFLLRMARPRLCYQCHTAAHGNPSNPLAGTNFNRGCQNCHSQIHGSNHPAGVLFQR